MSEERNGYAIKSSLGKITDRRYPILSITVTNIHQPFHEIKHFEDDQWQGRYRGAARQNLKEAPETPMHNTTDARLNQMWERGSAGSSLPDSAPRIINAMERQSHEVRRNTRPVGTFGHPTSIDRIILWVFTLENLKEKTSTPFLLLTQST